MPMYDTTNMTASTISRLESRRSRSIQLAKAEHLRAIAPEDHLPAAEWARQHGLNPRSIAHKLQMRHILTPYIKKGHFFFVHKDAQPVHPPQAQTICQRAFA